MNRQPAGTPPRQEPEGIRFFAYVDRSGGLTVRPYGYEQYTLTRARADVLETTDPFTASGHVEARREARQRLGHLERSPDLSEVFGSSDGHGEGGDDQT